MASEKMARTAGILDRIIRVLKIIMIICAVGCVAVLTAFTVISVVSPGTAVDLGIEAGFTSGMFTFTPAGDTLLDSTDILIYVWIEAVLALVFIALVCYALGIFRKILKPMTEGNPFYPSVSTDIRKFAFVYLIGGMIQNVMSIAAYMNLSRVLSLNGQPENISMNYVFDLDCVVGFIVLLLISYIFSYGEKLQKLSDETL